MSPNPPMQPDQAVLDWLLDSDPAIRWQVLRDLAGASAEDVAAERARVGTEGWGAQLLALQAPDGRWGVSAGGDGIRIWDVPQQRVTNVLGADLAPTNSVAISPDGEFVYSAGDDGVVRQWRVSDGTVLRAFAGHVGPALAVALSPDGNLVASGGQDGTVRLWDSSVRSNR